MEQFKKFGLKPKAESVEVDAPPFPSPLRYVWDDFLEILSGVAGNGMAPLQVSWRDIRAWSELTGTELAPWEARLLVRLGVLHAIAQSPPKTGK